MKVLVTGGAGFIGSHLVDRLIVNNYDVIAVDNLFRGKLSNIQKHIDSGNVEFFPTDIRDYDELQKLFYGVEVVYHLAAQSNVMGAVSNMDYSFESNVIGTYNVLKAASNNNVKRIIFSSSREAYGEAEYLPVDEKHPLNAKNSYGASKAAGEKYCQVFQNMGFFEMVILRLANVYGLRDFDRVIPIFINNVLQNKDIHIFGGGQLIDFISVELVIDVFIDSIENRSFLNGPINVGSGKGTSLFDLAEKIKENFPGNSKIIVDPAREVEVVRFTADISRLRELSDIIIPDDTLYLLENMANKLFN
jgi:UDP-glucose 4-epimerase